MTEELSKLRAANLQLQESLKKKIKEQQILEQENVKLPFKDSEIIKLNASINQLMVALQQQKNFNIQLVTDKDQLVAKINDKHNQNLAQDN